MFVGPGTRTAHDHSIPQIPSQKGVWDLYTGEESRVRGLEPQLMSDVTTEESWALA